MIQRFALLDFLCNSLRSLQSGRARTLFIIFCFLSLTSLSQALEYEVEIRFDQKTVTSSDKKRIAQLQNASTTLQLISKHPLSQAALKRRADRDIETFRTILWAEGFFSCDIKVLVTPQEPCSKVLFNIHKGPQYHFDDIQILSRIPLPDIFLSLQSVGLEKGKRAHTQAIEMGERQIISFLKDQGYPLAKVEKRTCIANRELKTVDVAFTVDVGPSCIFGPIQISGGQSVLNSFFTPLCPWEEGDSFSEKQVLEMQSRLEKSGLFKSVIIKEGTPIGNKVPIEIVTEEALMRTIGGGISYTTTYGPGLSALWMHRNIRGSGEQLEFRANIWEHNRTVTLGYTIPHFLQYKQNLIYVLEYDFITTLSYVSSAVKASAHIEQKLTPQIDFMRGVEFERLRSKGFDGNHLFRIAKLPLQVKWSNANNILDPTQGMSINCKLTPAFQLAGNPYPYLIHTSSLTLYSSFFNDKLTLAAKGQLGNIFGESEHVIPLPDRFLGGSDSSLRGYKNLTVAPLTRHGIPMGGRSLLTGTLEARLRTSSPLGWVAFVDAGNVYHNWMPDLNYPLLFSTGFGVRYKTPIGPLRLDIAFPLNRRPKIDPPFQIYFSIGQSF